MISHWLQSPEALDYVRDFVRKKRASGLRGMAIDSASNPPEREETEELCQEFLVFLLEQLRNAASPPSLLTGVTGDGPERVIHLAWGKFLWQQAEFRRDRKKNPRGYLYRRLREFLSASERFELYQGSDNRQYFGKPRGTEQRPVECYSMEQEKWTDWPGLPETAPIGKDGGFVVRSRWLEEVSAHFLQIAEQKYPGSTHFPVSQLASYVAAMTPLLNHPLKDDSFVIEERVQASGSIGDPEQLATHRREESGLRALVNQLVEAMDWMCCCILAWRMEEPPRTYESIAGALDLAGSGPAHKRYRGCLEKIRKFCKDWPGPDIDQLESRVAENFLLIVVERGKTKCGRP